MIRKCRYIFASLLLLSCVQSYSQTSWWHKVKSASTAELKQGDTLGISLILPFNRNGKPNGIAYSFFSGALMAMYDLGADGTALKMDVMDCADGYERITDDSLAMNDVILGPTEIRDIKRISYRNSSNGRYLVSPIDPAVQSLTDSMKVIQAPLSHELQIRQLADWAAEENFGVDTYIIVEEKGLRKRDGSEIVVQRLEERGRVYKHIEYLDESDENDYELLKQKLSEATEKGAVAKFIIASENEIFVTKAIKALAELRAESIPVVAYCNVRLRALSGISKEEKGACIARMIAGYYMDEESAGVQDFSNRFESIFGSKPSLFSFQGYDLVNFLIGARRKFGADWAEHLEGYRASGLQTEFDFRREPGKEGFVNHGSRRIKYSPEGELTIANN